MKKNKFKSLDAFRGLAALMIVMYHSVFFSDEKYNLLISNAGVFVDFFFVISGFLITTIIYDEIQQKRFSIISFYERRVRRIFPALFAMMLVTTIIAYFMLLPMHFKDYGQSMVAATLFGSNILFWKESGYFAEASETKPLLHTWSLGVEEQFYIFFPILLLLLYRYYRERIPVWIIALSIFSLVASVSGMIIRPTATFFLLPTRAWELFVGSLLALGIFPVIKSLKVSNILALLGILSILYAIVSFSKVTPFPGLYALFPVLGAFLIIYSGTYHETIVSKYLSNKLMIFTGLISYSLYLWHWPVIVFYKYCFSRELLSYEIIVLITISFILGILSWKYVETPFRKKTVLLDRKKLFITALTVMVLAVGIGGWLHVTKGYPKRLDDSIRDVILANESAMTNWMYPDKYNNFKNSLKSTEDMNYFILNEERERKVLFWGDSHIGMIFPAIQSVFEDEKITYGAILGTSGGCLPVRNFNRIEEGYFCDRFNNLLSERAKQEDIASVVIGSRWDYIGNRLNKDENSTQVLALETVKETLKYEVSDLIRHNKKVYIVLPFPRYSDSVPLTLEKYYMFGLEENLTLNHKEYDAYEFLKKVDKILRQLATETGATLLDPKEFLCKTGDCMYQKNGVSLYRDSAHLNTEGALVVKKMIETIVIEGQ